VRRYDNQAGRFTLIFLAAPGQEGVAEVELTHNWDPEDYSGGRLIVTPAARRPHGVRPHARRDLDRAAPVRRRARAGRALGVDAEYGRVVSQVTTGLA
jgi:lactoylglutathione lyase